MSKRLINIFLVLILISCKTSKESKENIKLLSTHLIGEWSIVTRGSKFIEIKTNLCPIILFTSNCKAFVKLPQVLIYNYSFNNNKINFLFDSNENKTKIFHKKEYYYKLYKKEDLEILELVSKDGLDRYEIARIAVNGPD